MYMGKRKRDRRSEKRPRVIGGTKNEDMVEGEEPETEQQGRENLQL